MATACGDVASPFRLVHAFARNAGLADAALSDLGRSAATSRHWSLGTSRPELDVRRQRLDRGQFSASCSRSPSCSAGHSNGRCAPNNGRSYWDGG